MKQPDLASTTGVTEPGSPTDVLRRFVRDAPTALAMFDTQLRYLAASEPWRVACDLGEMELIGRSHFDVFPHIPDRWRAVVLRGLEGVVARCEADPWTRPSGSTQWLRWEVRPWFNEIGAIGGITIFLDDITERIEGHNALVESERRLRFALDASNAGTWTLDLVTGVVTFDERARAFFGYGSAEGDPLEDLLTHVPPDYQAHKHRRVAEIQQDVHQNEWDEISQVTKPDGSVAWVHSLGRVARDEAGQALSVSGIIFDVTAQQRADQSLRLALSSAHASAWTWRIDGDTGEVDERGANVFQIPTGTARPRADFQRFIHPDDLSHVQKVMASVRNENRDGWDMEYRLLLPDGGVQWRHSIARSERDLAGRVVSVSGIATDVTARKHAELELEGSHESLRAHAAELERRMLQLRRLTSDLTLAEQRAREQLARTLHDHLQQLLFSARLNIERAVERPADHTLLERAGSDLKDAIASARSLSVELFPPVLHLRDLPEALKWLAEHEERSYGITVSASISPDANVEEDDVRTLLFESVRELLFNAVKHARVDHVSLSAVVDATGRLEIKVSDEGIGFDSPPLSASSHDGGLGLVSIRERLELFGGTIEVDSAPGRGTHITLRVAASQSGHRLHASAVAGSTHASTLESADPDASRPLRVLIADDHELVRAGLRELINEHPEFIVVGEAQDGAGAVTLAATQAPDVVIMDVSMPGLDGISATRRIRAHSPQTQVIGLSTLAGDGKHAIESAGASRYFSKSDGVHQLIAHLRELHRALGVDR